MIRPKQAGGQAETCSPGNNGEMVEKCPGVIVLFFGVMIGARADLIG